TFGTTVNKYIYDCVIFFFFQAEDGIRDRNVTGVQTCALPISPSELRRDLPREIDAVVLRAMKKSPAQRYPSWAEFAAELSKLGEQVLPRGTIPDSEKYVALKTV